MASRSPQIAMGVPVQAGRAVAEGSEGRAPLATIAVTRAELERMKKEMDSTETDSITVPYFLRGLVEVWPCDACGACSV